MLHIFDKTSKVKCFTQIYTSKIKKNLNHYSLEKYRYRGTPFVRPPLLSQKCDLSKGWPLSSGRNQYIYVLIYMVGLFSGWPHKMGSIPIMISNADRR